MKKRYQIFSFLSVIPRYPVSWTFIAAIWVACFMDVPDTPLSHVSFIDKWTHFVMYGSTCTVICLERLRYSRRMHPCGEMSYRATVKAPFLKGLLLYAWLLPALMSGLIEILQATCTGGRRSGEWLDFAANSVGATLGLAIGILVAACHAIGRKDC